MRFHLVDVFAERRYTGNQLAVVESRGALSDDRMQQVAAEMDYSETTFIESFEERDGGYDVRIFTPRAEIPFAGHPTLGTAFVLREQADTGDKITLNLGVGQVPVRVERDEDRETLWMTQQPAEFGESLARETLADVLSLTLEDLDGEWPVQVVSTGLPTVVVPLVDRDALEQCEIDRRAYDALVGDRDAKNILVFCTEPRDDTNDLAVRVFAPGLGVPEDPATGSSNGCLAGYLDHYNYFGGGDIDVRIEQGYEMGRPSLLHLRADATQTIEVGGRVVPVARGELLSGDD
jgi:trans-2,3-dihydro-3-hydroxyanthranilate isomerase